MLIPKMPEIIQKLETGLGDSLITLYLVGSAATEYFLPNRSDVNLLLIIDDDTPLLRVHETVNAQWNEWQNTLIIPPAVSSKSTFIRHMQLNPALAAHMHQHARLLAGREFAPLPRPEPLEVLAAYCSDLLHASAALSPTNKRSTSMAYQRLHRLARRLVQKPLAEEIPARKLFALIQGELNNQINDLRSHKYDPFSAPLDENNLVAIYQKPEETVLVIPEVEQQVLAETDWPELVTAVDTPTPQIVVATLTQLRISLFIDEPVDYALQRYEYQWGREIFSDRPVSRQRVYKALARKASDLLVNTLPQQYLPAKYAEEKYEVVHELQNRILNLHLQVELLRRLHGYPFSVPSIQLAGRETPVDHRISFMCRWLDHWTTYYSVAGARLTNS